MILHHPLWDENFVEAFIVSPNSFVHDLVSAKVEATLWKLYQEILQLLHTGMADNTQPKQKGFLLFSSSIVCPPCIVRYVCIYRVSNKRRYIYRRLLIQIGISFLLYYGRVLDAKGCQFIISFSVLWNSTFLKLLVDQDFEWFPAKLLFQDPLNGLHWNF